MLATHARSIAIAALLLFSTMTFAPAVSAVGPNQSDMGMTSGDLPDNLSSPTSVPNLIFSGSTTGSGDLVSGTDEFDYLRVALASNEGLAAELSFSSGDDFDLAIYDTNQNTMASSYFGNPETVSTNSSFTNHGGMVYIEIAAYLFSGTSGSWNLTIWTFSFLLPNLCSKSAFLIFWVSVSGNICLKATDSGTAPFYFLSAAILALKSVAR